MSRGRIQKNRQNSFGRRLGERPITAGAENAGGKGTARQDVEKGTGTSQKTRSQSPFSTARSRSPFFNGGRSSRGAQLRVGGMDDSVAGGAVGGGVQRVEEAR